MVRKTPQAAPGIRDRCSEAFPAPASSPAGQSTRALPRGVLEEERQKRAQICRKGKGGRSWPLPPWCLREASFFSGACAKMKPLPQGLLPTASQGPGGLHGPRVWLCTLCLPELGLHRLGLCTGTHMCMAYPQGHSLPGALPYSSHSLKHLRTKECQKK